MPHPAELPGRVRSRCAGVLGALVATLAVAGVTAPAVAADSPPANVAVSRGDLYAYQDPWLASDPRDSRHLAVAYREGDQRQLCLLSQSHDGGATWTTEDLLGPGGRLAWPAGFSICYEGVVAFAPDGTLYYAVQAMNTFADPYSHVLVATSTDGGVGFKAPELVDAAVPAEQDRAGGDWYPRIAVDRSGAVHVRWTRYTARNRQAAVMVASSPGRGAPFAEPVTASPAATADAFAVNTSGAALAAGDDGSLYTSWLDLTQRNRGCTGAQPQNPDDCRLPVPLYVAASHDGGRSFAAPVAVDAQVDYGCPGINQPGTGRSACGALHFDRGPEQFSLAAGTQPGSVYCAWWGGDPAGATRISFAASTDGGRTWSTARVVGIPAGRDSDRQHRAQLAVAASGRVDLVYYDVAPGGGQDVYWIHSEDAGAHFSVPARLTSTASDSDVGPLGEDGIHPGFGAWLGVTSSDSGVEVAWTDARRGNRDNAKQDVFFARVETAAGGRSWWWYAAPALAAAVVAGATAPLLVRRRRRARHR